MKERILEKAERLFEPLRPAPIISEYDREQLALRSNFERLKAERLERESNPSLK